MTLNLLFILKNFKQKINSFGLVVKLDDYKTVIKL